MADVILEFLVGSGIGSLASDFTLGDLIPYILRLWIGIGVFRAVFGAFAAVFAALLEGVQ